jgi:hypothetical protein
MWTLATNRGVAGLGGADAAGLGQALGRWSNLGLIGVPLVAFGLIAAVAGWPRGWRGGLIAAWALTPAVGLAHHTLGLLFHYLYIALPGMALAVGALVEWSNLYGRTLVRPIVGAALAMYLLVSAATLWTVLAHVEQTGAYPGSALALGRYATEVQAVRSVLPTGAQIMIGGQAWESEMVRFSLGHDLRARLFDDCGPVPVEVQAMYVLNSERRPAASALKAAGAPLLARVPWGDDAFVVYGAPPSPLQGALTGPRAAGCP